MGWGLLGGLLACTTPSFDELDAASRDDASDHVDTATVLPVVSTRCRGWQGQSPLPDGAEELVGRYAARIDSYGFDDIAAIQAREHEQRIMVVDITPSQGGLQMAARTCDWTSSYDSLGTLLTATSGPQDVASLPVRVLRMTFGADCSWSAASVSAQLWGYSAGAPLGCAPGATVARSPQQSWLSTSCTCPKSDTPLPTEASDCRLGDPDSDGFPGVTLEWRNEEVGREVYHVAMRDESELMQGSIDAQGVLTARERRGLSFSHLGGDFPRMKSRCPDDTSRVTLKRLAPAEPFADSCPDALRAFWAEAEPTFPERDCVGP